MEYYLNNKFKKYFKDVSKKIVISDGSTPGVPLYWQSAEENVSTFILYNENENGAKQAFRWQNERSEENDVSFIVNCPQIDTKKISEKEMTAMIAYIIDRYKVAGKSYLIKFN